MEYIPHNWDAHHKWNASNGDYTHRLNYALNSDSIIFDIGGYEGWFAGQMFNKYGSNVFIFEPVEEFFNKIENNFNSNKKVKSFKFGLGAKSEFVEINLDGDGSSHISDKKSKKEKIEIKSLIEFLEEQKISQVDLVKINIEAAEFDLLDDLIKNDKLKVFKNIQVQFHTFIPDCVERRDAIRKELSKTHELTYDFAFIWESWKLK